MDRKFVDLTGQRFGQRMVLRRGPDGRNYVGGGRRLRWIVRCDCGREDVIQQCSLRQGDADRCVTCRTPNLRGQRFGRWLVLDRPVIKDAKWRHATWWVRCDCGTEKIVAANALRGGKSRSCLRCRANGKRTHGLSHTSEYGIWRAMLRRCFDKNDDQFQNYGGRGITVCPEWDPAQGGSLENFLRDVGLRPSPQHSLDRIDVNGRYESGNVQWALLSVQARNTRRNVYIDVAAARALVATIENMTEQRMVVYDAIRVLRRAAATPDDSCQHSPRHMG